MGSNVSGLNKPSPVDGALTRRGALRGLFGASSTVMLASACLPVSAAAKATATDEDAAAFDPAEFLRGFLVAQQDRDLRRLKASFVPNQEMIWVHHGRRHRGERAFLAWLATMWAGSTWGVTPDLATMSTTRIGRDGVFIACPVIYRHGDDRRASSEAITVSLAVARMPLGPRISALIAAAAPPPHRPRFR